MSGSAGARPPASEASPKKGEAGHEDGLAVDKVAQPSSQQQKAPEREGVGADHPLQVCRAEMELALLCRQGHVDD
jgi:hypothetical protein